jgi:hypothetical protein
MDPPAPDNTHVSRRRVVLRPRRRPARARNGRAALLVAAVTPLALLVGLHSDVLEPPDPPPASWHGSTAGDSAPVNPWAAGDAAVARYLAAAGACTAPRPPA